jgi:hypothetical protein
MEREGAIGRTDGIDISAVIHAVGLDALFITRKVLCIRGKNIEEKKEEQTLSEGH